MGQGFGKHLRPWECEWEEAVTLCPERSKIKDLHPVGVPRDRAMGGTDSRNPAQASRPTASWASGYNHSGLLFCPQHTSTLGSVFGDAYYEQQMTARQANALSRQVSGCPGLTALPASCCRVGC